MKLFLLLIVVSFFFVQVSNSQTCQWAEKISGTDDNYPKSIVVDGSGNVYVMGAFLSDTISFNNGISLSISGLQNGYIAKYNPNGICQWAEKISGGKNVGATSIAVDGSGNVYVAGCFKSALCNFNNGISLSITSLGMTDAFIAKYNSKGICQWAQLIGGTGEDRAWSIAVDELSNVYVTGDFFSPILNFNNSVSITNSGDGDVYFTKYNSSGTCQWAQKIKGTTGDIARSIAVDRSGNVYVAGIFLSSTLNFNKSISLTNSGSYDTYIAKYNTGGTFQWAQQISGTSDDRSFCTVTDGSGNVYVAGYFISSTLSFNNGISLTNSGLADGFISKYNSYGTCQWAQKISGPDVDYAWCIAVDNSGNVYVGGDFQSKTLIFNNGNFLTNSGLADGYIAQYNSGGSCQWVQKIAGIGNDRAYSIAVNDLANTYVAGWFSSPTINFNSGISLTNSNAKYLDAFIAKYVMHSTPLATFSTEDSCGTSIDYYFTDDSYVYVKVLNQQNVDAKISRNDNQHISVHVRLIDQSQSGYVKFEAGDDLGNKTTVNKTLMASNNGQEMIINPHPVFDFGKVAFSSTVCKEIEITNPTIGQIILDTAYMTQGLYYSFPQSQLPMVFGPNETKKFSINFTPQVLRYYQSLDTLILRAGCIGGNLFITGLSDTLSLDGNSECDINIKVTLRSSKPSHVYPIISPIPSNGTSNLNLSLESDSDVKIEMFDCLGSKVKEEHYSGLSKGENNISIDFSNNATGIYYLIVRAEGNQNVIKVVINK